MASILRLLLILLFLVPCTSGAWSISFNNPTLDLSDMTGSYTAGFVVESSVDYTLSTPATGILTHTTTGDTIGYCVTVDKDNSTLTVTPNSYNTLSQRAGNYTGSIVLTMSALQLLYNFLVNI